MERRAAVAPNCVCVGSTIQQELDDIDVAVIRRIVHRSEVGAVSSIDCGREVEQQPGDLEMAAVAREMEHEQPVGRSCVGVGLVMKESSHIVELSGLAGIYEGSFSRAGVGHRYRWRGVDVEVGEQRQRSTSAPWTLGNNRCVVADL